jgi:hypothetical protein
MGNAETHIGPAEIRPQTSFAAKGEIENVVAAAKGRIILHYSGDNHDNYFHESSIYTNCRPQLLINRFGLP